MAANTYTEDNFPKVISVDDHVVEPADTFERWLPGRYRDAGPHIVRRRARGFGNPTEGFKRVFDDDGEFLADCWQFGDVLVPHKLISTSVGFERDDMGLLPITYEEMRPGATTPKARLEDMDLNWVDKSMRFPTHAAALRSSIQ